MTSSSTNKPFHHNTSQTQLKPSAAAACGQGHIVCCPAHQRLIEARSVLSQGHSDECVDDVCFHSSIAWVSAWYSTSCLLWPASLALSTPDCELLFFPHWFINFSLSVTRSVSVSGFGSSILLLQSGTTWASMQRLIPSTASLGNFIFARMETSVVISHMEMFFTHYTQILIRNKNKQHT